MRLLGQLGLHSFTQIKSDIYVSIKSRRKWLSKRGLNHAFHPCEKHLELAKKSRSVHKTSSFCQKSTTQPIFKRLETSAAVFIFDQHTIGANKQTQEWPSFALVHDVFLWGSPPFSRQCLQKKRGLTKSEIWLAENASFKMFFLPKHKLKIMDLILTQKSLNQPCPEETEDYQRRMSRPSIEAQPQYFISINSFWCQDYSVLTFWRIRLWRRGACKQII